MKRTKKLAIVILVHFALPLIGQSEEAGTRTKDVDKQFFDRCRLGAIRIVADPATHQLWLLKRDYKQPAAPAILVPLPTESQRSILRTEERANCAQLTPQGRSGPAIRSGDSLIVSEHTSISDVRLEAIALSTAGIGEVLTIRLKIGSPILHAVVVAPGQAGLLVGAWEMRP